MDARALLVLEERRERGIVDFQIAYVVALWLRLEAHLTHSRLSRIGA